MLKASHFLETSSSFIRQWQRLVHLRTTCICTFLSWFTGFVAFVVALFPISTFLVAKCFIAFVPTLVIRQIQLIAFSATLILMYALNPPHGTIPITLLQIAV